MDEHLIQSTLDQLRNYLANHPDCADTLDGVYLVWLSTPHSKAITQIALERLAENQEIEAVKYGRAQILWRNRP